METKLRSIKNNPLLGRAEADIEIDHEGESTPSKEDVKSRLAAEEDFDPDKLEVMHIYTGYGKQVSEAKIIIAEPVDEEEYEKELEEHTPETPEEPETVEETEDSEQEEETEPEDHEEEEVEESEEATEGDETAEADYEDIVSGTISDAKDRFESLDDPDWEAALKAEKANKNRTTFIDWLESQ